MGVSRAALSQNLKALEQRLNVKLLYRTTRDMSLTDEGLHLFEALQPALASIERAVRNIGTAPSEPAGLLRINTSRVAAKSLLEPHLDEFFSRYPKLKLEIVMDDGMSNIIADGCDAGIRLGEHLAEHMVALPITPMLEMAVCGSPAYFEAHGKPQTPADLTNHNCLSYRFVNGSIFHWEFAEPENKSRTFVVEPHGCLTTNDDEGMVRAGLQSVGLIQHMELAVRPHLKAGTLVRVLENWSMPFTGFYLYVPSREQMAAKVRALIDFLVEKREALAAESIT